MALDASAVLFLNALAGQSPLLDWIIVFLASYLPYILVILFVALVFFSRYPRWQKLQILFVAAVASVVAKYGVTELIRFFYHRPRPFSVLPVHELLTNGAWSFPSGHAAFFFALATAVYLYNKTWGIGFFIAAALVSLGRVAAGVHYLSDVVAGALIGIAVAYVVFHIARRLTPPQQNQTY